MKLIELNTDTGHMWINAEYIVVIRARDTGGAIIKFNYQPTIFTKDSVQSIVDDINNYKPE